METIAAFLTTAIIMIAVVAIVYQFVSKPGGPTVAGDVTGATTSVVGDLFK